MPTPSPLHPGICGALVGLYHHIGSSLSPRYVGDSRILSWGMWGISRRFDVIRDCTDRSRKDFWVHFRILERTQVFTGICGIRFIVIQVNTSINRPFPSSLVPLFQSESKCETILMKMTLICMKMKLHAELIFVCKVSDFDSFWNWGARELGNDLFRAWI